MASSGPVLLSLVAGRMSGPPQGGSAGLMRCQAAPPWPGASFCPPLGGGSRERPGTARASRVLEAVRLRCGRLEAGPRPAGISPIYRTLLRSGELLPRGCGPSGHPRGRPRQRQQNSPPALLQGGYDYYMLCIYSSSTSTGSVSSFGYLLIYLSFSVFSAICDSDRFTFFAFWDFALSFSILACMATCAALRATPSSGQYAQMSSALSAGHPSQRCISSFVLASQS